MNNPSLRKKNSENFYSFSNKNLSNKNLNTTNCNQFIKNEKNNSIGNLDSINNNNNNGNNDNNNDNNLNDIFSYDKNTGETNHNVVLNELNKKFILETNNDYYSDNISDTYMNSSTTSNYCLNKNFAPKINSDENFKRENQLNNDDKVTSISNNYNISTNLLNSIECINPLTNNSNINNKLMQNEKKMVEKKNESSYVNSSAQMNNIEETENNHYYNNPFIKDSKKGIKEENYLFSSTSELNLKNNLSSYIAQDSENNRIYKNSIKDTENNHSESGNIYNNYENSNINKCVNNSMYNINKNRNNYEKNKSDINKIIMYDNLKNNKQDTSDIKKGSNNNYINEMKKRDSVEIKNYNENIKNQNTSSIGIDNCSILNNVINHKEYRNNINDELMDNKQNSSINIIYNNSLIDSKYMNSSSTSDIYINNFKVSKVNKTNTLENKGKNVAHHITENNDVTIEHKNELSIYKNNCKGVVNYDTSNINYRNSDNTYDCNKNNIYNINNVPSEINNNLNEHMMNKNVNHLNKEKITNNQITDVVDRTNYKICNNMKNKLVTESCYDANNNINNEANNNTNNQKYFDKNDQVYNDMNNCALYNSNSNNNNNNDINNKMCNNDINYQMNCNKDNQVYNHIDNKVYVNQNKEVYNSVDNKIYNNQDNENYNNIYNKTFNKEDNQVYRNADNKVYNNEGSEVYSSANNFIYNNTNNQIYSNADNQIYSNANNQIYRNANNQIYSNANNQIYSNANNQIYSNANNQICSNANNQVYSNVNNQVHGNVNNQAYSNANNIVYNNINNQAYLNIDNKVYNNMNNYAYNNVGNNTCNKEDTGVHNNANNVYNNMSNIEYNNTNNTLAHYNYNYNHNQNKAVVSNNSNYYNTNINNELNSRQNGINLYEENIVKNREYPLDSKYEQKEMEERRVSSKQDNEIYEDERDLSQEKESSSDENSSDNENSITDNGGVYTLINKTHNRIDMNKIPRPIINCHDKKSRKNLKVFETCKYISPPTFFQPFISIDTGKADPRFIKSTLYQVPLFSETLKLSKIPFGVIVNPFASLNEGEEVDKIDMKDVINDKEENIEILRCPKCFSYLHATILEDLSKSTNCVFCETLFFVNENVLFDIYQYNEKMNQRENESYGRISPLLKGSVDILLPPLYFDNFNDIKLSYTYLSKNMNQTATMITNKIKSITKQISNSLVTYDGKGSNKQKLNNLFNETSETDKNVPSNVCNDSSQSNVETINNLNFNFNEIKNMIKEKKGESEEHKLRRNKFLSKYPQIKKCLPPYFVFVVECSYNAVYSNITHTILEGIRYAVQNVTCDKTKIAIITFNSSIYFYNCKKNNNNNQVIVMSDIDNPFIPLPLDDLFFSCVEELDQINNLIDVIKSITSTVQSYNSCGNSALKVAIDLLKERNGAGSICMFYASTPNCGVGAITDLKRDSQENFLEVKQKIFYDSLLLDLYSYNISADTFIISSNNIHICLPSLQYIAQNTGGKILYIENFIWQKDYKEIYANVKDTLTSEDIAYYCELKLRYSQCITVKNLFCCNNNFNSIISVDTIKIPKIRHDHTFAFLFNYSDVLETKKQLYIQCACIYTNLNGDRFVRLHTTHMNLTTSLSTIFRYTDAEALMGLLIKQLCTNILHNDNYSKIILDNLADILFSYRVNCASSAHSGQLILPDTLKLLPLFISSLLKHNVVKKEILHDLKVYSLIKLMSLPIISSLLYVYPITYLIHIKEKVNEIDSMDIDDELFLPRTIPTSAEKIYSNGIYLMDACTHFYLYFGYHSDIDFTIEVLGKIPTEENYHELSLKDTINAKKIQRIISNITRIFHFNKYVPLVIVAPKSNQESHLISLCVEDKVDKEYSYVNFLCFIHKLVHKKIDES